MPIVVAILALIACIVFLGWEVLLLMAIGVVISMTFGKVMDEEVEHIARIDLLKSKILEILEREIKGEITHDYKCERPWVKVSYDGSVYMFYFYWTKEYGYGFYQKGSRIPFHEAFYKKRNDRYVAMFRKDMYLDEHFFDVQLPPSYIRCKCYTNIV